VKCHSFSLNADFTWVKVAIFCNCKFKLGCHIMQPSHTRLQHSATLHYIAFSWTDSDRPTFTCWSEIGNWNWNWIHDECMNVCSMHAAAVSEPWIGVHDFGNRKKHQQTGILWKWTYHLDCFYMRSFLLKW
jgi:hypothetical protein